MGVSLAFAIYHRQSSSPGWSLMSLLQSWVEFGVGGGAIAISALLCQRPQRALAFMLGALSLFALWKFYVGVVFFKMLPQLGGLSFSESVADYWRHISKNIFFLVGTVPPGIFVGLSAIFWPLYALFYESERDDRAA